MSTIRLLLSTLTALTATASAQRFNYNPELAIGGPASEYNVTNFIQAEQSPQYPTALNFTLFNQPSWTWRINVSEVALNSTQQAGVTVSNATAYVTSYDIQWPAGGNLTNGLDSINPGIVAANKSFCAAFLTSEWSDSTQKAWKGGNGADCASAIGQDCINAVMDSGMWTSTAGNCESGFLTKINECKNKFTGTDYEMVAGGLSFRTSYNVGPNNQTYYPLESGAGIFYRYSPLYSGANTTYYDSELARLHTMIFYDGATSQIFCGRVATSAATGLGSMLNGGLAKAWLGAAAVVVLVMSF